MTLPSCVDTTTGMSQSEIRAVTVYCSSSKSLDARYYADAVALGKAIARENWTLVYGGNDVGLMSSGARGARAGKGKVIGITPQLFVDKGYDDKQADELIADLAGTRRAVGSLAPVAAGVLIAPLAVTLHRRDQLPHAIGRGVDEDGVGVLIQRFGDRSRQVVHDRSTHERQHCRSIGCIPTRPILRC